MKNHCGGSVGFSFRAALWFRQRLCLCEVFWDFNLLVIFTVEYKDSVSFSFLFSFFFVKNQIASFFDSSKLLCFRRVRVYILAYFIA